MQDMKLQDTKVAAQKHSRRKIRKNKLWITFHKKS